MTYDLLVKNDYTVVDREVLLEKRTHTGNLPGRVLTNARHQAH